VPALASVGGRQLGAGSRHAGDYAMEPDPDENPSKALGIPIFQAVVSAMITERGLRSALPCLAGVPAARTHLLWQPFPGTTMASLHAHQGPCLPAAPVVCMVAAEVSSCGLLLLLWWRVQVVVSMMVALLGSSWLVSNYIVEPEPRPCSSRITCCLQ